MSVASPDDRARPAAGTPASAGRRLRYKLRIAASEPTTLIGVLMAALFAYLIVVPIVAMLLDSVTVQLGDQRRIEADVGGLTWYYLERTFTSRVAHNLFWGPLVNTLSVALGAIVLAMAVGGTLAWLLARTDMFGRRWFATALIVPYMLPAWTFALAWTTLFKNRTVGGQAGLARDVRLLAARLAGLRPGAGDDHPGAALRAVRHPAVRQRARGASTASSRIRRASSAPGG